MAVLEHVAERSSFIALGTGTLGSSMYLLNVVSFFSKYEGKRRFVVAFKTVIGLYYLSRLP